MLYTALKCYRLYLQRELASADMIVHGAQLVLMVVSLFVAISLDALPTRQEHRKLVKGGLFLVALYCVFVLARNRLFFDMTDYEKKVALVSFALFGWESNVCLNLAFFDAQSSYQHLTE